MSKSARKPIAILVALMMLLGAIPLFGFSAGAAKTDEYPTQNPLIVEVKTNKSFYTLLSTIEFTATIKNTSRASVARVSAEALFGADLSPLETGEGKTSMAEKTIPANGTVTLTYKAQVNKLKALDILLYPFMWLRNLSVARPAAAPAANSGTEEPVQASIEAPAVFKIFSFFAARYNFTNKVVVKFGDPSPTQEAAMVSEGVKVLTDAQSADFIANAQPSQDPADLARFDETGEMTVSVPAGVTYQKGDIFMVRPSAEYDPADPTKPITETYNPLGITGKVVEVKPNGDIVMVQPEMDEVFDGLQADINKTLTAADIISEEMLDGVEQSDEDMPTLQAGTNFNFSKLWDINYKLVDQPLGSITLGGKLGFKSVDIGLNADIDIKNLKDIKFSADAKMNLYADVNLTAKGKLDLGFTAPDPLLSKGLNVFGLGTITLGGIYTKNKIPLVRLIFDVGTMSFQTDVGGAWTPAMLAASLELTSTLGGTIEGEFKMGASYECYVEGGFSFANGKFDGYGSVDDYDHPPSVFIDAALEMEAQARVGVDVCFYALGCKLAAITNDIALMGNASGSFSASFFNSTEPTTFEANGYMALKVLGAAQFALKAKAENVILIGNFTLIDIDKTANLYSWTIWDRYIGMRTQAWEKGKGGNGHVYAVFEGGDAAKTWEDAQAFCTKLGGHLVTITSEAERDFVRDSLLEGDKFSRNFYWLGGKNVDTTLGGSFDWVTGEPTDYTNWNTWQYDTGGGVYETRSEPLDGWATGYGYMGIWRHFVEVESGSTMPFKYGSLNTWFALPNDGNVSAGYTGGFICEWD